MVYETLLISDLWLAVFGFVVFTSVCAVGVVGYFWESNGPPKVSNVSESVSELRYKAQDMAKELKQMAQRCDVSIELKNRIFFYPTYILLAAQNEDGTVLQVLINEMREEIDRLNLRRVTPT